MTSERYDRQLGLAGFGSEAQARLASSSVLVVGAGGLGTTVLTYLNAMGIGCLGVVEHDTVATSNLHRQVLYTPADVGEPKLALALARLRMQNPATELRGHPRRLDRGNALELVAGYDLVVDCTDNLPTRYLVNDACVIAGRPLVYGAVQGWEGQVSVFNHRGGPTYRCLFPFDPVNRAIPDCAAGGVLGVLPALIGSYQALEVTKVLTGTGETLTGKLLLVDGSTQLHRTLKFAAVPANRKLTGLEESYGAHEALLPPGASIPEVPAAKLDELLAAGELVVDVRSADERNAFRLERSRWIPLPQLAERARELPAAADVYLVCASGGRSRAAVARLTESRPDLRPYSVAGGLSAYRALPASIRTSVSLGD